MSVSDGVLFLSRSVYSDHQALKSDPASWLAQRQCAAHAPCLITEKRRYLEATIGHDDGSAGVLLADFVAEVQVISNGDHASGRRAGFIELDVASQRLSLGVHR
jgi:hypothetical protein